MSVKNKISLLIWGIIAILLFFVYFNNFDSQVQKNEDFVILSEDFDYNLRTKNDKENMALEWYSSYFLTNNCSAIFLIVINGTYNYFKIISVDGCFNTLTKKLERVTQSENVILFDYGLIKFNKSKIYFEYKDENLEIFLDYFKINKNFVTKGRREGKYFGEYSVLSPKSEVRGYIKLKNKLHLIKGIGYFDHMQGVGHELNWIWGWIPEINNQSLIFAYAKKSNITSKIIILSDQNKSRISNLKKF